MGCCSCMCATTATKLCSRIGPDTTIGHKGCLRRRNAVLHRIGRTALWRFRSSVMRKARSMGVTWRGLSCIGDSLHTGGWFGRCPLNARDRYEAAMRIHGSYSGDDLSVRGGGGIRGATAIQDCGQSDSWARSQRTSGVVARGCTQSKSIIVVRDTRMASSPWCCVLVRFCRAFPTA